MKVKDPYFVLEKIRKYLDEEIKPGRYRATIDIPVWKYRETSMEEAINGAYRVGYDDGGWADFHTGDTWGGYDRVAWFRAPVEIPESFRGGPLAVRLLVGPRDGGKSTAETLLYIDGHPVQGIDIWHEEALLEESLCRRETLHLALKAWSGVLAPPKFRTFRLAQLVLLDRETDQFYFTADTVLRCAALLNGNDLRRIRLTQLLDAAFRRVNFLNGRGAEYYRSVHEALDFLRSGLKELETDEIKPTVYGVGHSHIDMAWLWRLNATREKASRTFATVLNLMKQYPEYRFMHSSPQLYKFLQEDYPELFRQVKERIREGRWEITGGMWVEADTNLPSGESLVRQFLYGKRYIRREFGKETRLVWLPDAFGYSAALPQIMKKSGMKYFMTTKISWNQYNRFPHDTFWWQGIDGSRILTHFITTPEEGSRSYTYNGHMDPEEAAGVWENYKDKDKNDELLIAYGWGDGGGGPTREMLERSRVMKNIPGIPRVKLSGAEEYFERIYERAGRAALAVWDGELYFELHRGTYTSQAANKRANRKTEVLLHDLEALSVIADVKSGDERYPKEDLDALWERTLLDQFHDILPGSAIRQVYEDTAADYEAIRNRGTSLREAALGRIAGTIGAAKDGVAVYNTSGFERDGCICIPYGGRVKKGSRFSDETGPLDGQDTGDGVLVHVKGVPPYGYKTLACSQQAGPSGLPVTVTQTRAENRFYAAEFNENGEISSLYDKENGREVGCGKPMNVFAAFEDKPLRFDAWDVDVYYKEKPYAPFVLTERRVLEASPQRGVLRQAWRFNKSTLTQDFILYGGSRRIDFRTTVDWKEKQVFLKVRFPVGIHADEATYEIQFGSLKRPTHANTGWDFAKFEVPGHRWADLSESGYGVSLLNDCKYGWDIRGNTIGLSLLKSAVDPDETADRRIHRFTYSLYPHSGAAADCDVQKEAVGLNLPLLCRPLTGSGKGPEYEKYSFVRTDSDHVAVDTVKKAEEGRAYVVRLYEYRGRSDGNVSLRFAHPVRKIAETNLCEEGETEVPVRGGGIRFPIGCFEIKTFKIYC